MKCTNRQFGEVEYAEEHLYEFRSGIIGFEQLHKFVVINDADSEPFRWLISVEDEDISMPLLDPTFIDPLYLTNNSFEGVTVAAIASLKEPVEESTVNLRSPILFDQAGRTGKQIILDNERYPIQQRFIGLPQHVAGE